MFRQMAEDRFVLYLMLMSLLGLALGFFGVLVLYVALSWTHVAVFLYSMFERGWT